MFAEVYQLQSFESRSFNGLSRVDEVPGVLGLIRPVSLTPIGFNGFGYKILARATYSTIGDLTFCDPSFVIPSILRSISSSLIIVYCCNDQSK